MHCLWFRGTSAHDRCSHDITVGTMLGYLKLRVTDALPADRYPNLELLSAACKALPEFAATVPAADETMPARGT